MNAGGLNQRVRLEAQTATQGSAGGVQKSWVEVATVWAAIRHFNGEERRATATGGGEVATARTEITIRYRPSVTAKMRAIHQGVIYNIVHVNNWMQRNESLVLTCDTGANDG